MSAIVIVGHLHAKPGRGDELLALFAELAPLVLSSEPGCLRYAFHVVPASDPLQVVVIEKYASRTASDAHNSGVLSRYLPRVLELLSDAPRLIELAEACLGSRGAADGDPRLTV